jgi:hypothetical protein
LRHAIEKSLVSLDIIQVSKTKLLIFKKQRIKANKSTLKLPICQVSI